MDITLLITAIVACFSAIAIAKIIASSGSKKAYLEAIRVKDGIIEDLKTEIKKWKGKAMAYHSLPPGTEEPTDIVRALPAWARPLAKPLLEWAQTEEGKQTISNLIQKYASKRKEEGEEATFENGV